MQVGTTKDQGAYNKPSAAVRPGAPGPYYILLLYLLTFRETCRCSIQGSVIFAKNRKHYHSTLCNIPEEHSYLIYNSSQFRSPQPLSIDVYPTNLSAYQTGFKPRLHYMRITHSILSISAFFENSRFFDDSKVIGLPGHDTMSSRGCLLATKHQIWYMPSVHKSTAQGRLCKGDLSRETLPIMLTTGTQIDPITRVAGNPHLFFPCRPRAVDLNGQQGAVKAFRPLFIK